MAPTATTAEVRAQRGSVKALVAASALLFVLIVLGRIALISLYAESVPYWDQWDAEGAKLLKPWVEYTWQWSQLFAPHNEHRIALTRLIALALFEGNDGQWDNLVSAYFNMLIYATVAIFAFWVLASGLRSRAARAGLAFALLVVAWVPFGYDNTLIGFQNQFYTMAGLALLVIHWASVARDNGWLVAKLAPVAIIGLFTMASGLLGAVAAGAILAVRIYCHDLRPRNGVIGIAALATVSVGGYLAVPHLTGHDALRASSLADFGAAFARCVTWPSQSFGWLQWLPTAVVAIQVIRARQASRSVLLALGMSGWVILQCAAIAYSRGEGLKLEGSRYLDILAWGLVSNTWLALHLCESATTAHRWQTRLLRATPLALMMLALCALALRTDRYLAGAHGKWMLSLEQTINVRSYVRTGDPVHLVKPAVHIPYPNADRLQTLLQDRTLRAILPPSVRKPVGLQTALEDGDVRLLSTPAGQQINSCAPAGAACARGTGDWRGTPLRFKAWLPYLTLPVRVAGPAQGLTLTAVHAPAGSTPVSEAMQLHADSFSHAVFRAAPLAFELRDNSATASLRAQAPVETGPLSLLAMGLQDGVRNLLGRSDAALALWQTRAASPLGGMKPKPLQIAPGNITQFTWPAPATGRIERAWVLVGVYGGAAEGDLLIEVCSRDHCANGSAPLKHARDNADLEITLSPTLTTSSAEPLTITIGTRDASHPVVLWTYPSTRGALTMTHLPSNADPALRARTLRFGLVLDD